MTHDISLEQAFIAVYDEHADAIFRYCYFRVFNHERAKEIMQEAFSRTWEQIAKGIEIRNIRAFVYKIAKNIIIDESRRKKEESLEELYEQGFDPGESRVSSQHDIIDGKAAFEKMHELDDTYREVLLLRYVNDLKPKEIADVLGESQNVVSVRLYRAVKQLRQLVAYESQPLP